MKTKDIQMRDPFVLVERELGLYYLFGTTDKDCWRAPGQGFDVYVGKDLEEWDGPLPAFRPPQGFWGKKNFWAPESHAYRGEYYLLASFHSPECGRGTQILKAPRPEGPYSPHSSGPVTPRGWECLDGTLHVDGAGRPWMVFCHEWVQVKDGEVCAIPLSEDLRGSAGDPVLLFRGSEAAWTRPHKRLDGSCDPAWRVTDGPFLHRPEKGGLLLLWSSFSDSGYAIGQARSESGSLLGPWKQGARPLMARDSGHGMVFKDLSGGLTLTLHEPNATPLERPAFIPLRESGGWLELASEGK
jgi:hypothetical protein